MNNALFQFAKPANEPVKEYRPGSPERIALEKELERQQYIAYDYSISFDQALNKNNQKVKRMENE